MPLLKPRIMTPARLAANRRNALKSAGPKTARGGAQSRMSALRTGRRSPAFLKLFDVLLDAPPCSIGSTAATTLSLRDARHPVFAELVAIFHRADIERSRFQPSARTDGSPTEKGWQDTPIEASNL